MGDEEIRLPAWMTSAEEYKAEKDRDGYLEKSIMALFSMLRRIRENGGSAEFRGSAAIRMAACLLLILLVSLSRNMAFSGLVLAGFLVRLLFVPGRKLLRILLPALGAAGFALLMLLPSVFLGAASSQVRVSVKVFLAVGLVNLLSLSVPWNRMTEGLRAFHVPSVFLFILDLTLQFIAVLGNLAEQMLQAVRLRSVGRNAHKQRSLSGILGTLFLRARERSALTMQAMELRGFDGEYRRVERKRFVSADLRFAALMAAAAAAFAFLEGVM